MLATPLKLSETAGSRGARRCAQERQLSSMVSALPPTPAGARRPPGTPGLETPLPPWPAVGADDDAPTPGGPDDIDSVREENQRLREELRSMLAGHAMAGGGAESEAGSVSSEGSFGTAAGGASAGSGLHMRAQLEHFQSEVGRLHQKMHGLRSDVAYRDQVIAALRSEGGGVTRTIVAGIWVAFFQECRQ